MQIYQGLPIAEVVEKDGSVKRLVRREEFILGRRVHKSAALVRSGLGRICQDVVRAFHGAGEKDNTKAGPFPLLTSGVPLGQHARLIGLIRRQFLTDAVDGMRVNRRGAVVDLECKVEGSLRAGEAEKAVRLNLPVAGRQI